MVKKIGVIILATITLLGMSSPFTCKVVKAAENTCVMESNGDGVNKFTYSDTAYADYNRFKTNLNVTFIEDSHTNQLTALVSTEGSFIPSGLTKVGGYYDAQMYWPSVYRTIVESYDSQNKVKIARSIPTNQINTVSVSETMGYTIGGSLSVEASKEGPKAGAELNGSYTAERSVTYDQPDYRTLLKSDSTNRAEWQVVFNANKDGYDRDSYHGIYGNQLFMRYRLYNKGIDNLTTDNNLSPLISGGFSPEVVVALKAPKGTKTSAITVKYTRFSDEYKLNWSGTEWYGTNNKLNKLDNSSETFVLDWENHTVEHLY
ncbi:beta-channel forming cytolysin [Clostridium septicum]|uniref:Beta-channel forming cytolysin n=1 Tax=Clostridium septicum TaxID=1504 RepID=A0A9N7JMY3_CLOSE|nr:beta-channel forming cytolysin [Clostridium septicum]AYE34925.1 beta-channel forming cytolysin [Clostridium septicum]MDU1313856.1 beta-channel forming cytolysin [Clostridium septicum]QAS60319.1 beta-channel forming cytolysin [Clostridium septicum]UEC20426.1 beta-channel forming cytolysin [Clostridium septicum]USS01517.1 beta-channel forming cytolysin [Clostridium septicum]